MSYTILLTTNCAS